MLFVDFTLQLPLAQSTAYAAVPVPVKQVNPVHGAASVLAKQLSVFEQHPTTVAVVAVPVYDAVHEVAHE